MITPAELATMLRRNQSLTERQAEGLTHDDSVLQPPYRANCMNWVIGHMLVHRDKMLKAMGEAPVWDEFTSSRYDQGSEPITQAEEAVPFDQILRDLNDSQSRLDAALAALSDDALAAMSPPEGQRTLRERLTFLVWHDTYHTGQTEQLRQLAGMDDQVIA